MFSKLLLLGVATLAMLSAVDATMPLAMDVRSLKPMLPELVVMLLVEQETQAQQKPLERQSFLPVLTVQVQEQHTWSSSSYHTTYPKIERDPKIPNVIDSLIYN